MALALAVETLRLQCPRGLDSSAPAPDVLDGEVGTDKHDAVLLSADRYAKLDRMAPPADAALRANADRRQHSDSRHA